MGLGELILVCLVVGLLLYAIERWVPMDPGVKRFLQVMVVLILVVWVLQSLGILGSLNGSHLNDVRIR